MSAALRAVADRIHKWTALVLMLFFVLQAVTGAIIVNNERTMQLLDPAMYVAQPRTASEADLAGVLAALPALAPDKLYASVILPIAPDYPALAIVAPRARAAPELMTVDPTTGRLLGRKPIFSNVPILANRWHETMFVEPAGGYVLAGLGLALVVVSITGLIRWWPIGGGVGRALRIRWAGSLGRTVRQAHGPLGALFALAFLWLGVTGGLLVARPFLQPDPSTGGRTAPAAGAGQSAGGAVDRIGPVRAAAVARAALPGHRLMAILPMSRLSPDHTLVFADRFWRQARVRVSGSGEILQRYTPAEAPAAAQVFDWLLPLHRGSLLPEWARSLWYLAAFGLVAMAASGLVTNRSRARQRRPRKDKA